MRRGWKGPGRKGGGGRKVGVERSALRGAERDLNWKHALRGPYPTVRDRRIRGPYPTVAVAGQGAFPDWTDEVVYTLLILFQTSLDRHLPLHRNEEPKTHPRAQKGARFSAEGGFIFAQASGTRARVEAGYQFVVPPPKIPLVHF